MTEKEAKKVASEAVEQAKQASAAQQAEDIERKGQLFEGFANSKG
jgi:hypothetical protein